MIKILFYNVFCILKWVWLSYINSYTAIHQPDSVQGETDCRRLRLPLTICLEDYLPPGYFTPLEVNTVFMKKMLLVTKGQLSGKEPSGMCKTLGLVLSAGKKKEVTPLVFCSNTWRMTFILIYVLCLNHTVIKSRKCFLTKLFVKCL